MAAHPAQQRRIFGQTFGHDVARAFQRAKGILERDIETLHKMAEALIKYETIDDSQIADIMQGRDPKPPADWEDPGVGTPPDTKPRET